MTRAGATALAAALIALAALASTALGAYPGQNGKIAFVRSDAVWVMGADGSAPMPLRDVGDGGDPAWSPDGRRIALADSDPAGPLLVVMNADGSGAQTLRNNDLFAILDPTWSPDGTKIAYSWNNVGAECGSSGVIQIVNLDGTSAGTLSGGGYEVAGTSWSPKGDEIAYAAGPDCAPRDIYKRRPDGTGLTQLTTAAANERTPDWSPDGSKIVFVSLSDAVPCSLECGEIYVMNADGSNQTRLTANTSDDGSPSWSPDGRKILFSSFHDGISEIHRIDSDGSNETVVGVNPAYDPNWQPLRAFDPYPRPGGGSPFYVWLVPAFKACGSSNATHTPPLAIPSCSPPVEESSLLTTSTIGRGYAFALLRALNGDPSTVADEADIEIGFSARDVRCHGASAGGCASAGGDYAGRILLSSRLRQTDRANGYGGVYGTAFDSALAAPVDCVATPDANLGASCNLSTSADTLLPGFAKEGKRAVASLFGVVASDAGPNGTGYGAGCPPTCGDGDERVFLQQGLFTP